MLCKSENTALTMEKFAVDLDKVLDEFEFNEDREEQLLSVKRRSSGIATTNDKTGIVPYHLQDYPWTHTTASNSQLSNSLHIFDDSSSYSSVSRPKRQSLPTETKMFGSSLENRSQVVGDCFEKYGSSNKLNVTGVFSSLHEYINTGKKDVSLGIVDAINNEYTYGIKEKEISNACLGSKPDKENSDIYAEEENLYQDHNGMNMEQGLLSAPKPNSLPLTCDSKLNQIQDINNTPSNITEVKNVPNADIIVNKETMPTATYFQNTLVDEKEVFKHATAMLKPYDSVLQNIKNEIGSNATWTSCTSGNIESCAVSETIILDGGNPSDIPNHATESILVPTETTEASSNTPKSFVEDMNDTGESESTAVQTFKVCSDEPAPFTGMDELSDSELDEYLQELENIYDNEIYTAEDKLDTEGNNLSYEVTNKMRSSADELNGSLSFGSGKSLVDTAAEKSNINVMVNEITKAVALQHGNSEVTVNAVNNDIAENHSVVSDSSEDLSVKEHITDTILKTVLLTDDCYSSSNSGSNIKPQTEPAESQTVTTCHGNDWLSPDHEVALEAENMPVKSEDSDNQTLDSAEYQCDDLSEGQLSNIENRSVSSEFLANLKDGISNTSKSDLAADNKEDAILSSVSDTAVRVNMLNTSKVTSSVTNVISIECQQIKSEIMESRLDYKTSEGNNDNPAAEINTTACMSEAREGEFSMNKSLPDEENCIINDIISNGVCRNDKDKEDPEVNIAVDVGTGNNSGPTMSVTDEDEANPVVEDQEKPQRPNFLHLPSKIVLTSDAEEPSCDRTENSFGSVTETLDLEGCNKSISQTALTTASDSQMSSETSETSSVEMPSSPHPSQTTQNSEASYNLSPEERNLGKYPPFWVPDAEAPNCMLCNLKFTVLKRRHHCRACGKVLCSKCCSLKASLDYMDNAEGRVCHPCFGILAKVFISDHDENSTNPAVTSSSENNSSSPTPLGRQPNPNNPMEYCSTIPPLEQAASSARQPIPSVLVPVGVLKREGSSRSRGDIAKQVMFSDGIRPGGDLTELDSPSEPRIPYRRQERLSKRVGTPPGTPSSSVSHRTLKTLLPLDPNTKSYIPPHKGLPPLAVTVKGELKLEEELDAENLLTTMKSETDPPVSFALNRNLFVQVKIVNLNCCVNRTCWCYSTVGMNSVGQDEVVIILECLPNESVVPRDIFIHLNTVYQEASRGRMVSELGHSVLQNSTFLGSSDYGGFIYIRPSFQCLHKLILPPSPYLIGILIHRWETPWAKVFPIRLMLRLGAEFRYYPCMLVSVRDRKPVYCEIGHTIINLLADFRNLSYTLPSVRGLVIHMEDRHTSILLPRNRYDQVARALNNSNDHVLALAANFSFSADSHLVCIQSSGDESYHTQAINIHNKPRKVTGASFVVFNGALKMSSNLTAKSSIVEDGLMVQITPDTIQELRIALRNMKDFSISCGPAGVEQPDEMVYIKWVQDDKNFNIGVKSMIDNRPLDGIPSIRVHNGTDYMGSLRFIRWTEVFILQSEENSEHGSDPLDISRLSESIARATCLALINLLDLLAQAGLTKLAVRTTIHPENVGYEAGSQGEKLPPIYMNSLDNELIPVLHKAASISQDSPAIILELIFHVMLQ